MIHPPRPLMGDIGEDERTYEVVPMPKTEPAREPAAPTPAPAPREPVPV